MSNVEYNANAGAFARYARWTVLILCTTCPAFAQTFGELAGFVRDSSGGVIAGVRVTVIDQATNQSRSATTDGTGAYAVPFLNPGAYRVLAEKEGFRSGSRPDVLLEVGGRARTDFVLEIGSVEEVVEVRATAPLLQRENAAVGTVISGRAILDLPLNGRNYLSLVKQAPNVAAEMPAGGNQDSRQWGERVQQPISIAGQRQQFNRFTLDGVENTDVNFNTYLVRPSIEALREFKVQTGVYTAEHGRATSQIIAATRSGTNEFHGALFAFHRNDDLDARSWRSWLKESFARNQFGFVFGGPVIRSKLFFLSNLEVLRDRTTREHTANVATDRMRRGDLAGAGRPIFDPLTRTFETNSAGAALAIGAERFANDLIPQNRINPIAVALLEFYPGATSSGDDIFSNYRRDASLARDFEQFLQRFDYQESDLSSWFGRFSWGDERWADPGRFPLETERTDTRVYQGMISNTRAFGPAALNEFRASYNQFQNDRIGHFAGVRDVTAELGIVGLHSPVSPAWGVPRVGLADGLSGFGESTDGPWVNRNHVFQILDNGSIVRRRHSIKFGGEFRRDRYNHEGAQLARGGLNFDGTATADPTSRGASGHSFADFLLGEAVQAGRAFGISNAMLRATSVAFYLQDTWRLTSRLTLDWGLRYENTPPYHDKYRGIINAQVFDIGVGPGGLKSDTRTPILTRPGEGDFYEGLPFRYADGIPVQAGDQFMGRRLVASDHNDFAPRLGIAWSLADRWTVRSGAGLFYSQDIGNARFDLARNFTGRESMSADPERPNVNLSDPWAFIRQTFTCSGWDGPCIGRPFALANAFGRRTPYVWQWLFNIQRQLSESTLLEVGYQGNAGHKLERMWPFNQGVNRTGPADPTPLAARRPWPAYDIVQEVDGSVNSNYHALGLKAERRLTSGLTFLTGFTWSKAIDGGSAIRNGGGDRLFPANAYDLTRERGLSQFHTGRRLVAMFVYELPIGAGKPLLSSGGLLSKIVGDWSIASMFTFSDGSPAIVGTIGDRNNTGVGSYPDATGISPIVENASPEGFWNLEAFDTTNPELRFREGNVGRTVLTSPGFRNWDFSALKNLTIREGHRLQVRFEAFNFSNHPNWYPPNSNARNTSVFGKVWGAKAMRQIQFGLKYSF